MPLQNRVDPFGNLLAVNARGAWMGNRGILHDEHKRIVHRWRHPNWVLCTLEYKGKRREVFGPGTYSELFFLDEATAFSAGHRPCNRCRRERCQAFRDAWIAANPEQTARRLPEIDRVLHRERVRRNGTKVCFEADLTTLPDGTFIQRGDDAWLIWNGRLRRWTPEGYRDVQPLPDQPVTATVLTPRSIVAMYRNGFLPQVAET